MAEYAILLGILTIALLTTLAAMGGAVGDLYDATVEAIAALI